MDNAVWKAGNRPMKDKVRRQSGAVAREAKPAGPKDRAGLVPKVDPGTIRLGASSSLLAATPEGFERVTFHNLTANIEEEHLLSLGGWLPGTDLRRGDEVRLEFAGPYGRRTFHFTVEWKTPPGPREYVRLDQLRYRETTAPPAD